MAKFKIIIEDSEIVLRSKIFEANSLEDAIRKAESESWSESHGWEEYDSNSIVEIRDDLSGPVVDN